MRLLALSRLPLDGAYVAGGTALNLATGGRRFSRDVDLFHDSAEALVKTWQADQEQLLLAGYDIDIIRERPTFVEAMISRGNDRTAAQWVIDSAYRFFPIQPDPVLGATLHPLDLATNKILALAGRREVRDWSDAIQAAKTIQPLALLLWAAVGKDPGYSVDALHSAVSRTRFSAIELSALDFAPPPPTFSTLAGEWRKMLQSFSSYIDLLPPDKSGACVCGSDSAPFRGTPQNLADALDAGQIIFREGSIRGVWPECLDP
ncbi:MAG: nucleotidyl transferase AbiEii/AbiGii toxin family protein [Kiritimatiellia bacterium]